MTGRKAMGATALTRYASPAAGYFASVNQAKKGIESMKHYKNLGKRVLSLFVALIMCVSLLPGTAFAKDDEAPMWCGVCNAYTKVYVAEVAPTCTEEGYAAHRKCDGCKRNFYTNGVYMAAKVERIPARGHKYTVDVPAEFATCTEPGLEAWKKCSRCGELMPGERKELPIIDHNYMLVSAVEPTCGTPGHQAYYYCNGAGNCGKYWTVENGTRGEETTLEAMTIQPTGNHSVTAWVGGAPCEGTDLLGWCTVCVQQITKHVEPTGHAADTWQYDAENHWKVCTNKHYDAAGTPCGKEFDKAAHEFKNGVCVCGVAQMATICNHKDADGNYTFETCVDNGEQGDDTHTGTCSKCGGTVTAAHTYGEWSEETGSCATGYSKTRTCTLCGHTHTFNRPGVHERNYEVERIDEETHGEHCRYCDTPMKVAKHTFVNDVCKVCGATKPTTPPVEPECTHLGTKLSWMNNGDGTHTVTCSCGGFTKSESHTYDLDGDTKCKCGAEKPVHTHDWKYIATNSKPATCKEAGFKFYNCTCGETKKETVEKLDHDFTGEPEVVEATCAKNGSKTWTCKNNCGETKSETIPATPDKHNRTAVAEDPATCLTPGTQKHDQCSDCGKLFQGTEVVESKDLVIPALNHNYDDGVITTRPTCTGKGVKTFTCKNPDCGHSYTVAVDATGHKNVVDIPAVPATCTTPGKTAGKHCNTCDVDIEAPKDVPANGHTKETIPAVAATCTTAGSEAGEKCSVCETVLTEPETVAALGHDIVTDAAVDATCTETGLTEGKHCSRCNDATVAQETVAALGHDWDNGRVTTAATCEGAGVRTHTCERCSATETRAISAAGHSAVSYANVAATCTATGYTGGTYCSRCSAVITARTVVPATGHTWNSGVITTYPTYYSTGLRTYTCVSCSATRTEVIPQLTYTYEPDYDYGNDPEPDYDPPATPSRPSTNQPTVNIPDDDTPLGNGPTVTIDEEDTPLAERPLPFLDVANGDWFRPYVSFVYGKGMMTGMSDTLFGPNVSTTRGMIVTIIYRMEEATASGVSPFTDVERDEYYADPIAWASADGVVLGYSETLFGPKDNITREQMAAILYRYCVSKGIDVANYGDLSRFPDGDKVSDYAVEAMRWAVDRGLIAGMDDGRLDPTGTATRAQVATILNRFCEMIGA